MKEEKFKPLAMARSKSIIWHCLNCDKNTKYSQCVVCHGYRCAQKKL